MRSTLRQLAIGLAALALMSANSARATLTPIDEPVDTQSWQQQWAVSGIGTFTHIECFMLYGNDTFKTSGSGQIAFSQFNKSGWANIGAPYMTGTHILAQGIALNNIGFYINFALAAATDKFVFDEHEWNGTVAVNHQRFYYNMGAKGTPGAGKDGAYGKWTWDNLSIAGAPAPVPEPTTMIAGALLLLPFGASTVRRLRKNRAV